MKIIHTADLHIGQVIYQNYERKDEHTHFFGQLERWCMEVEPDALIVSGDVFDIQQPSASTWKAFTDSFVRLHRAAPKMKIVITAGNHDSAARIQSNGAIWEFANALLVGTPPSANYTDIDGWEEQFVVEIESGFIIALPYMIGGRTEMTQTLLDYVNDRNAEGKPVVMTGHLAVTGSDITGHDFDIGNVRTMEIGSLGTGYDYLALGHIHKPQTIGHFDDCMEMDVAYHSPVARYSGSALHVSCDEAYPHTVSVVEIDRHGGDVRIHQLRIDELRHFYILPTEAEDTSSYKNEEEALEGLRKFAANGGRGYFRMRIDCKAVISPDFNQKIYAIIEAYDGELRYNPKIIWTGIQEVTEDESKKPKFEIADIQDMTNPLDFIEKTIDQYPDFNMDELREAFTEIEDEVKRMNE